MLGKNIRKVRLENGLSLEQLSSLCNVSKSMLSNIERGKKTPTVGVALSIAQALGKEIGDLVNSHELPHVSVLEQLCNFPKLKGRVIVCSAFLSKRGGMDSYSPHSKGMTKFIILKSGKMEVIIDGENFLLSEGETLYYLADVPHTHRYLDDGKCEYLSYLSKPIQNTVE